MFGHVRKADSLTIPGGAGTFGAFYIKTFTLAYRPDKKEPLPDFELDCPGLSRCRPYIIGVDPECKQILVNEIPEF